MQKTIPDHTAVRVALWRAMHLLVDAPPHVFNDNIGLQLAAPPNDWQQRPDMHPQGTRGYRASIIGRARLIEDLVLERFQSGIEQYVILGAGLDTFAQRKPANAERLQVFEIDQPATQQWKQKRLQELGYPKAATPHFVPVNFETGESWISKLKAHNFDLNRAATISSTGVSMYLTKEANRDSLGQVAQLPKGSTLAMTFMLPLDMIDPSERPQHEMVYEKARAAGTPFISFFRPPEMLQLAREAGFANIQHVSRDQIIQRYFNGRADGLQPSTGEEFLIATC